MREDVGPDLIPSSYTDSLVWRFLLDTKAGAARPEEPRLKQFADNLRSFAVCGAILKAGKLMIAATHPFLSIGGWILICTATVVTIACAIQLLGLLTITNHWFVGWTVWDHIGFTADSERARRLKSGGMGNLRIKAHLKFASMIAIPLLLMFALGAFVFLPLP